MEIDEKALASIVTKVVTKAIKSKEEKVSAAKLYNAAKDLSNTWKSWGSEHFIDIEFGGTKNTIPLPSARLKSWLRHLYLKISGGDVATDMLVDRVVGQLVADASFSQERHNVHVRIAYKDGAIFIDMAQARPRYIKVTRDGWSIVEEAPVKFVKADDVLPLPEPRETNETLLDLVKPFLAVRTEEERLLLVGYLFGLCMPKGPYPVLVITGEHGAAKSTTVRLLRRIIDPHNLDMRAPFNDIRDLVAAVRNSYCLAFDNVSYVPNWLSDALCALATGTRALGGRALYTNADESAFTAMRPIMCNGIPDFVRKPDLVDRIVKVDLRRIQEYRSDEEYWETFEEAHPKILWALLDCMVAALRDRSLISVPAEIRMPHFIKWAEAASRKAGFEKDKFIKALSNNKFDANQAVLEFSTMGLAIRKMLDYKEGHRFYGGYVELRNDLLQFAPDNKGIPEKVQGIASELRNLTPSLNAAGIMVYFHGRNDAGKYRNQSIVEIIKNGNP